LRAARFLFTRSPFDRIRRLRGCGQARTSYPNGIRCAHGVEITGAKVIASIDVTTIR